jgi:hypothetical protein
LKYSEHEKENSPFRKLFFNGYVNYNSVELDGVEKVLLNLCCSVSLLMINRNFSEKELPVLIRVYRFFVFYVRRIYTLFKYTLFKYSYNLNSSKIIIIFRNYFSKLKNGPFVYYKYIHGNLESSLLNLVKYLPNPPSLDDDCINGVIEYLSELDKILV